MELIDGKKFVDKNSFFIEIYGLGYVGFPLAVRLSSSEFKIIGIDVNNERIERLKNNNLMDSELYLKDEFLESRNKNFLELDNKSTKNNISKIGIICVPTPIPTEKITSDIYVKSAVIEFLKTANPGDVIILESSIEVGTTEKIETIIEENGFEVGKNIGLCFCPERIDPANKEWGIENIPRVIYCSDDASYSIAKIIYENVNKGNLLRVSSPKIAEIVKSFENAFRLVNIALVNELAILCDNLEVNVKEVIDAAATKPFGFMPHYPGAGAGGHCIPKDPRFLLESAKKLDLKFNTIEHALEINHFMPKYVSNSIKKEVENLGLGKNILICGLSYKANVEDMRDSPSFKIIEEFHNQGYSVYGYDPYFDEKLSQKYMIENHLEKLHFEIIKKLDDEFLEKISGICIVQHHDIIKEKIKEIYEKSTVPLIYDCQSKLLKNKNSKTKLVYLGN
ncbi:nucleotide sugar dehydrogenase [Nitrosopumilus sp.]|uniref:nucleotide sugar dehydrogenase n=1 Tax=Nitrosopumilus sp. TaxID=2024843 RepID=UPI002621BCE7|nr:nucleotide sugar dehydrogenase [Nitrosopumilus sp.]